MKYKEKIKCVTCKRIFEDYKSSHTRFCSLECAYLYRPIPKYKQFKKHLKTVSKSFLLWFTGFWEGEGNISIRPNVRSITIQVSQNDKNIIELIRKSLQTGKIYSSRLKSGKKHYHFIIANLGESLALAETLIKYVKIVKRKRELKTILNLNTAKRIGQYA